VLFLNMSSIVWEVPFFFWRF